MPMRLHRPVLWATLLTISAGAGFAAWQRPSVISAARRESPGRESPVLWPAPAFELSDQHGRRVSLSSLRGHVWIADFIFTSCTRVCPMITARMRMLQRALPDPTLRFVSFSVDPDHDTTEALRAYAARWAPDERRWSLLRTDPAALRRVTDGMRVIAEPSGQVADPITHTSLFFLIDGAGRVRGMYDSASERAFSLLVAHAQALAAEPPRRAPREPSGEALFAALGCSGCHDDPVLAPPLASVWGRDVTFTDGTRVQADAAYLRESIVAPAEKIVSGYRNAMPSYASYLSEAQVDSLIEYLRVGAQGAPTLEEQAGSERDPVCGMRVQIGADTPHLRHDSHDYYFCSERCRTQFAGRSR